MNTLAVVARRVAVVRPMAVRTLATEARNMSTHQIGFKDREQAFEKTFFSKEDEKLMRQLLSKMKAQAEVADAPGSAGAKVTEEVALRQILDKYGVPEAAVKEVMQWKEKHF